jgi:hypothetical protein
MSWAEMRVSIWDDLDLVPYRLRLICTVCGGREFSIRPSLPRGTGQ